MQIILENINSCGIWSIISAFSAVAALFLAWIIPKRIMINQRYSDLLQEYRSCEIYKAIDTLFLFWTDDCGNNKENVWQIFKERVEREIQEEMEFSERLIFQYRLVSHFYSDVAKLYLDNRKSLFTRLNKNQMKFFFTSSEQELLHILLHINWIKKELFKEVENTGNPPEQKQEMKQYMARFVEQAEEEGWL